MMKEEKGEMLQQQRNTRWSSPVTPRNLIHNGPGSRLRRVSWKHGCGIQIHTILLILCIYYTRVARYTDVSVTASVKGCDEDFSYDRITTEQPQTKIILTVTAFFIYSDMIFSSLIVYYVSLIESSSKKRKKERAHRQKKKK